MDKRFEQSLAQRKYKDGRYEQHVKRCSASLLIRETPKPNYNEVSLHTGQNGHH